jgi:C4-dicarboxylate transporter DctM subunit
VSGLHLLDEAWQRLEARLCAAVLVVEIASLTAWIALNGLAKDFTPGQNAGGLVFRGLVSAAFLGGAAHLATRKRGERVHAIATTAAVLLGLASGRLWAHAGVHYASNLLNWLQNASVLMLIGGLRGLVTRLTLWVALLGASLATSRGKHIHVDLLLRYVPAVLRKPTAIVGQLAAALVCSCAVVGFIDHIAIAQYRTEAFHPCPNDPSRSCDTSAGARLAVVRNGVSADLFLLGRQASLDLRSLPRVLAGQPYDRWMTASEWNTWLDGADWSAHFKKTAVDGLRIDPSAPGASCTPQVSAPGTGEQASGLLVRDLNFVFPFGLAVIALKLLVRALLLVAGRVEVDPDDKTAAPGRTPAAKVGLALGGLASIAVGVLGGVAAGVVVLLALLGTPLFAIMGGSAELLWLSHPDAAYRHLRYIAPTVLDERFADSPILVTIPLFTFVGYVLAEAKTPDRLVAAARTVLGWMPGGLAIVAIVASAVFTVLTGGSGVTIIAIGGLLYPALRKQGYSEPFALGLVTTGGSVGLLLPMSLPLLVYALVAHVDFNEAFKAVVVPGLLVVVLLSAYSAWVGTKEKVDTDPPEVRLMAKALWDLKWELGIPALLAAGLGTGLTAIDEAAGLVAFYTVYVEFFVYRDLSWKKDLVRIAKGSMSLAGAIILILAMANALMNYVTDQHVPTKVLELMTSVGIRHMWQFLVVMNVFLLLLGMLMEGFSAILVAVPLILPFVARLGSANPGEKMSPFQLAMIFLLNLEIAYCMPPLGLNLFIASFRFNRPVSSLYRVVLPFVGILTFALALVSYVPWFSNVAVASDVAAARTKAEKDGIAPRDAWMMQCVQEDPSSPQPCSAEDARRYPGGQLPAPPAPSGAANPGAGDNPDVLPDAGCNPDFDDCTGKK